MTSASTERGFPMSFVSAKCKRRASARIAHSGGDGYSFSVSITRCSHRTVHCDVTDVAVARGLLTEQRLRAWRTEQWDWGLMENWQRQHWGGRAPGKSSDSMDRESSEGWDRTDHHTQLNGKDQTSHRWLTDCCRWASCWLLQPGRISRQRSWGIDTGRLNREMHLRRDSIRNAVH